VSKTHSGIYDVINKEKYAGTTLPIFRSSWELVFMRFCDNNPHIEKWASEPLKIPYFNPIENKYKPYKPDFLVVYNDKNGSRHAELVEIKPAKETHLSEAKSKRDKLRLAVNAAKWMACNEYCKAHGMTFRVITESDLFNNH